MLNRCTYAADHFSLVLSTMFTALRTDVKKLFLHFQVKNEKSFIRQLHMHRDVEGIMTEHTLPSVRTKTTSIHHTDLKGERRMLDQISQWVGEHCCVAIRGRVITKGQINRQSIKFPVL